MNAVRTELPGGRWHFQHGPIDIVIGADGRADALNAAHGAAWARFQGVLAELVAELPALRQPVGAGCTLQGVVARRMWQACAALPAGFITPMAAVAGAVAQELIGCYQRPGVLRAWVNNGGDIALHLAPGQSVRVGLFADLARLDERALHQSRAGRLPLDGQFQITAAQPVRGLATSGWRGRSFSFGIADSVTVLAATAAQADAAATMVANAVDVDDARIQRRPANSLKDGSDLGERLVTVAVPALAPQQVQGALWRGMHCALDLQRRGLLFSAALVCQGRLASLPAAIDLAPEATLNKSPRREGLVQRRPNAMVGAEPARPIDCLPFTGAHTPCP